MATPIVCVTWNHRAMLSSGLFVAFVATICCAAAQTPTPNYRLARNVLPINYEIELTPYLTATPTKAQFTFDGIAKITLATTLPTESTIVLHAQYLNFTTVRLYERNIPANTISITSSPLDDVTDKLTLNLQTALKQNVEYILEFIYVGTLHADMYGFYRSSYTENGETKWAATTQFQPGHARKVFPCFDEPSFKATFDISITRPTTFQPTVSNTRISNTLAVANGIRETFVQTPIMSTYLIAFIVSEFQVRSNADGTFGVLARPSAYAQTEYALNVGQPLLQKLDEWTNYKYNSVPSMSKMHMAALPDFSAGAMENWGLLTYRETALLYDAAESTDLAQQRVASVITHEQAHMWFGDLVTCEWWSYTWLNEGFARFFQYFGTSLVETKWELENQFVVEQVQAVLLTDSLASTHPMTYEVNSPSQVSSIFDNISYNKGASVLRMVQHLIGANNFQAAVQEYLKANAFNMSTPEKLYTWLQIYTPTVPIQVRISSFLDGWTTQSGYPVVSVQRINDTHLTISQERFLLQTRVHNDNTRWEIPLTYANGDRPNFASTAPQLLMRSTDQSISLVIPSSQNWTIFNVQQTGYYRVNYDSVSWKRIETALKASSHSGIHVLNRAQVVDDVLNLARADYVNYTLALGVVQYLETETNYIPWLSALNNLNYVIRRLEPANFKLYQEHIVRLTQNIYKHLGFVPKPASDSRLDVYNRVNILGLLCVYGHDECVKLANEEFAKLASSSSYSIPPNVRPVVYCSAVANETQGAWDLLWNRFRNTNVAAEQITILNALGCTKNNVTLTRFLNLIITDAVRLQDKSAAFTATFNQQNVNVDVVLDFVFANHVSIAQSFGSTNNVATILGNLAARFNSQAQINRLQKFVDETATYKDNASIARAIADAKFNLEWANKHVPEIMQYIKDNGSAQMTSTILLIAFAAAFVSLFH